MDWLVLSNGEGKVGVEKMSALIRQVLNQNEDGGACF